MAAHAQETLKNGIAFILLFVMLFNLIPVGIFRNIVYAEIVAEGEKDTCTWTLNSEGTLTIRPTDGVEGSISSNGRAIWIDYVDQVRVVNFQGTIRAGDSLRNMFRGMKNIIEINFNDFDTSATTDMGYMFRECTSLKKLDLSMFSGSGLGGGSSTSGGYRYNKVNMFPKGMWRKQGVGEYTNRELNLSSNKSIMKGIWTKTANIERGLEIMDVVDYAVELEGKEYEIKLSNEDVFVNEVVGNSDRVFFKYTDDIPTVEDYILPGSIEVVYKDAARMANGDTYDFKIVIDNMHVYNLVKSYGPYLEVFEINVNSGTPGMADWGAVKNASGVFEYVDNKAQKTNFDVTMQVTDSNGNVQDGKFIFAAYDLDVDTTPPNITLNDGTVIELNEGINFRERFYRDKIFLSKKTRVLTNGFKTNLDVEPRVYGVDGDSSTESSMVIAVVDSGFEFTWTAGKQCVTEFMNAYNPAVVKFRKVDEQGNTLAGAELSLYMQNSNEHLIESWTTTNEDKAFFLNPGTYILRETKTPDDSYELAEEKIVYVESDGTIAVAGEGTVEDVEVKMINYKKSAHVIVNHYIMELDGTKTEEGVPLSNGGRPEQDARINGQIGEGYTTQALTEEELADEYEYVEVVGNPSGVFTEETQYVTYYYRLKKYPYSVNYYDKETRELIGPKTKQGEKHYYGTEIETEKEIIEIEGYEYDSIDPENILTIDKNEENNVINIYYIKVKKIPYKVNYYDKETGELIGPKTKQGEEQLLRNRNINKRRNNRNRRI